MGRCYGRAYAFKKYLGLTWGLKGAQYGHTQRGAIGGQVGHSAKLFLCRKMRNLPILLEHFALPQRDYGKHVPALASGGAARGQPRCSLNAQLRGLQYEAFFASAIED
jgi:hypothetical protein